jgi:hypothetical protein
VSREHEVHENTVGPRQLAYGHAAAAVGVALMWFAIWTIECNVLVLAGFHYPAFLWALLLPTLLTTGAWYKFYGTIVEMYGLPVAAREQRGFSLPLVAAILLAAITAVWAQRTTSSLPFIGGTLLVALLLWKESPEAGISPETCIPAAGWRLPLLFLLLAAFYYFGHRADLDEANFVNLAIGAQRTRGAVFELDTMLGDGPGPIHLPTYKFHSFELLAAALSSMTGFEPITVLHLGLPLIQLVLLTLILMLTLAPFAMNGWLAAAILWTAFLFVNENTLATWGVHGVIRLFEGKAFLVSGLVPLIAGLSVRWFRRGQQVDLIGLALANICAIGCSANGIYGGPLASGFVAAAFLSTAPASRVVLLRTIKLLPTIAYPALIASLILFFGLAFPSEVTTPMNAINSLCFVTGFWLAGHIVLVLIALGGVGFARTSFASAALAYVPLTMLLTLNPLGWHLINAMTGNLGFRAFWSIPAGPMAALVGIELLRRIGIRSEARLLGVCTVALGIAAGWNMKTSGPMTAIIWQKPDLKVVRADYDVAHQLASGSDPKCRILAPERISAWLTTIPGASYPIFARELYLIHYRFTMSRTELDLRQRLRMVVDGNSDATPPSRSELDAAGMAIDTIAVDKTARSLRAAESLSESLGLIGPMENGTLLVWAGPCAATSAHPG